MLKNRSYCANSSIAAIARSGRSRSGPYGEDAVSIFETDLRSGIEPEEVIDARSAKSPWPSGRVKRCVTLNALLYFGSRKRCRRGRRW